MTKLHIDFVRVYFDRVRVVGVGVQPLNDSEMSSIGRRTGNYKDFGVEKGNVLSEVFVNIDDGFNAGRGYIGGLRLCKDGEQFTAPLACDGAVIGHINANQVWDHKFTRSVTRRETPEGAHPTYSIVGFSGYVDSKGDLCALGVIRQLVYPLGFRMDTVLREGPIGNEFGTFYSDPDQQWQSHVSEVKCWLDDSGKFVTGLQVVHKENGAQPVNGFPNAGHAFSYTLQPDEMLVGVTGAWVNDGLRAVGFVVQNLKTGQRKSHSPSDLHPPGASSFSFGLPPQQAAPYYPTARVYGFLGRYDGGKKRLMSIGAYFTPYTLPSP